MPRLPVFLQILAVTAAAFSAVVAWRLGEAKRTMEVQLAGATTRTLQLQSDLAASREQTSTLRVGLDSTATDLAATREKLTSSELRGTILEHDLAQTRSIISVYEQTARALADEVTLLKADLADTRATFGTPEAVAAYKNTIAELERQLANSRNGAAVPGATGASTAVFASRVGRATVLTVGPSSAFVVLNFGSARGAQLGQRLNISQGNDPVATVLISDVRTNFSIAQVQAETLRGVLQKGDLALLIR